MGEEAWNNLQEIRYEVRETWGRIDLGQREGALGRIGIAMTHIDAAYERIGQLTPEGKPDV